MGWWSPTILGGDEPLDDLHEILQITGDEKKYWKDDSGKLGFTRKSVEKNIDKMILKGKLDSQVWNQVVAVAVLVTGAKISDENRQILINDCEDLEIESWTDPPKRQKHLDDLKTALKNHKAGQKTFLNQEGFFSIILNTMEGIQNS